MIINTHYQSYQTHNIVSVREILYLLVFIINVSALTFYIILSFFFLMIRRPPRSTLFPSPTLFRPGGPRQRSAVAWARPAGGCASTPAPWDETPRRPTAARRRPSRQYRAATR